MVRLSAHSLHRHCPVSRDRADCGFRARDVNMKCPVEKTGTSVYSPVMAGAAFVAR